jgi:hypothetical protein
MFYKNQDKKLLLRFRIQKIPDQKKFRILRVGIGWYYGCSYIEDNKDVPDEGTGDVDYGGLERLG